MNFDHIKGVETPTYYYDLSLLQHTLLQAQNQAKKHNYKIHYAVKANNNPRILKAVHKSGLGADCVSGREIDWAMQHGFKPDQVVFAGVGKTDEEIQFGIEHQIACFNVESVQELEVIGQWAVKLGRKATVSLRINPNIDAQTHRYITTGLEENKFGVFPHHLQNALSIIDRNALLSLKGLHFHIGSQITDMAVYRDLCLKVNTWNEWFLKKGYDLELLNLGGGLGVNYADPDKELIPDFKRFFQTFATHLKPRPYQKIHFELGRSLVANCGSLIAKVLYIKEGAAKRFAILDAGMTELLRPALYQAEHKIQKLSSADTSMTSYDYDIVGPICESSDYFGRDVHLPELKRGDFVAIRSTGAYGEVMSLKYNMRKAYQFYYQD